MFFSDPVSILLLVLLCLFLIKISNVSKPTSNHNAPPGPTPLPIIGNLHMLNLKRPYKTFQELAKKYGSVFSFQIGSQKMVVLCGYETVKDALVNHAEEFSERPHVPIFDDITKGYGIAFSHGDNWKTMRRFTLSTLRDYGMGRKITEEKISEECEHLMKKMKSFGGKPFENTMIINAAVANIIVSIVLGHRINYGDAVFQRLMSLINENVRLGGSPMVTLYNSFHSVMRWLPGNHKTIKKNVTELCRFIVETFTKYKEQLDINDQRNLVDTFLAKQQEEKSESAAYFHNENLTVLILNLFVAGMETTSSTLRWGLLLMMKYPEIQKNVQNEIEKVIGSAVPQTEHRREMPYTDAVIHEIQRFGNIVPMNLPHATTQDVTFRGYFMPKGTFVMPLLASVLRDKSHFEKPDEFYPQHFLDSNGCFMKNEAFLPFSAGKRSCAGENLAKMELFLFFTTLLQNFTFQAPPGAELDLTPVPGIATPPVPYYMCAVPRTR
ncbi:cytochrome P450 2K4-like [Hyperolius riggenbachi]|uniref:cytochrome P450 2K4-like n=1 Tax=Hyperolius riggenbachi TaxID=752182 RepID=UPI0035A3CD81